ncbi:MAG: hypothetical protein A2W25_10360 [candidate division Zixibacteria bacterium RBG_16_53_22]|nr:MAG: hypothetical protein A2W25_10360 [candidate division Zixibacteria bacterium RBG_16_53_22]
MIKGTKREKSREPLATILIIAVFFISINLRRWLVWLGFDALNQGSPTMQLLIGYLFWVVPSLLTLLILYDFDFGRVARDLGLKANPWKAVLLAFLFTLPMMLGYYATTKMANLTASIFFKEALLPGIFEEYIFRGFLIGQLFKRGRLGFIPAVIIGSFAFALGHLYQGATIPVMIGVIFITAVGSAWFAWLFIEWGRNLYLVMSMHAFMNLWWSVFSAGQNALGGVSANVIRLLTVAITVIVTIIMARRTGFKIKGRDWISAPRAERH